MVLSAKVVSPHAFFFLVSYFYGKQLKVMLGESQLSKTKGNF